MGPNGNPKNSENRSESNLFAFSFNSLEDGLECTIREATFLTSGFIVFISCTESLRTEVECISKWFVNTRKGIVASHKDLWIIELVGIVWQYNNVYKFDNVLTLSKAVEQALGWVQQKIGFIEAIVVERIEINRPQLIKLIKLMNVVCSKIWNQKSKIPDYNKAIYFSSKALKSAF